MRPLVSCTLLFVSIVSILLPKRAAKACGFYVSPGEYRFWLLQPDLTNQYDLTPFFFASGYLYKNDMQLAKETYETQNVNEWYNEINGGAGKQDIEELLYNSPAHTFLGGEESIAKTNTFMRFLLQPKNKELLRYMTLSKKVEMQAINPDPWDESELDEATFTKMKAEALALQKDAKTDFVKFRTAFQLIRMHAWRIQLDAAQVLYDRWIEPAKNNSWIKSAALYQIAINSEGLKKHYLLSKVFDRGDYHRTPCLVYFDSRNLDSIVSLAKNNHERNVMYAMKAFNYPGRSLQFLQDIYRSEPGYKDLPFLLLREINKVEDWLLTTKLTAFDEPATYPMSYDWNDSYSNHARENFANDKAYAQQLYQFIVKVINESKAQPKALLNLYAAHLCLVQKDYACSETHLKLAEAAKPADPKAQMQIKINRLLLHLETGFGEREEKELMAIINTPGKASGLFDPDIMKNQLVLYTGRKLLNKGMKAKGLMLLSKTNRALGELPISNFKGVYQEIEEHAQPADYDEMLRILDKKQKTGFEKFIAEGRFRTANENNEWNEDIGVYWDRNKLLDSKSSWYLRNRKVPEAYATLQQVPDSFWKKEPYTTYLARDAFYVDVYRPWPYEEAELQQLNKKQVLQKMIYLEDLAKKDARKAGECYYQLANAWYNLSYYGKNWLMVKQWWSRFEMTDRRGGALMPTDFNEDYYGCRQAKNYYAKAIAATADKKLAALCYFMEKECDKRAANYRTALKKREDAWYYTYTKTKINYPELRKKGVNAQYMEKLVNECELYQSFIKQYKRKL